MNTPVRLAVQFGRRNLLPFQRSELALKMKEAIKAKAKANKQTAMASARMSNPNNKDEQFSQKSTTTVHTDDELSKMAGVLLSGKRRRYETN
ncbi:MAG: hypothetical protein VB071_09190 [Lawsonibacter sp.]|nr:hypothetical protein [Lawsonibacter sp.]